MKEIPDMAALRAHMGAVSPLAERKVLDRVDRHGAAFIALSPFLVLATSDGAGGVDASPRGDPPGFVRVLDEHSLFLPDRPGNNRVDSLGNVVESPGVGLLFFVPGIDETYRVNGRARVVTEPALLESTAVNGKAPRTGLLVEVTETFFHCAKALKRSHLWDPAARVERATFPSLGRIIVEQTSHNNVEQTKGDDVAAAEARIETSYRERLY